MTLNIDLTDVAAHAIFNGDLTGIQRVQIEFAKALTQLRQGSSNVFANVHDLYHDLNALFPNRDPRATSEVFGEIRRWYGLPVPGRLSLTSGADRWANALLKLKLAHRALLPCERGSKLRLGKDDVLYVGGRFLGARAFRSKLRTGGARRLRHRRTLPRLHPGLISRPHQWSRSSAVRADAPPARASGHDLETYGISARRSAAGSRAPALPHPPTVVPLAHEFSSAPRNHAPVEAPSARTVALVPLKSFALTVGTVEIRKNHARLLHLWESMARERGEGWPKLIIAGKRGWQADEALRALRRADNQSPYLWIEAPTDEELVWLYSRASFTVFPSLAEGWGMPIGESLWFGKPCVASNTTSMPEVGGDLCCYGDPHDIGSFAHPIMRLVSDANFYAQSVAAIKSEPLAHVGRRRQRHRRIRLARSRRRARREPLRTSVSQREGDMRKCPPPDGPVPAPV